jgi:hypothetical protein
MPWNLLWSWLKKDTTQNTILFSICTSFPAPVTHLWLVVLCTPAQYHATTTAWMVSKRSTSLQSAMILGKSFRYTQSPQEWQRSQYSLPWLILMGSQNHWGLLSGFRNPLCRCIFLLGRQSLTWCLDSGTSLRMSMPGSPIVLLAGMGKYRRHLILLTGF